MKTRILTQKIIIGSGLKPESGNNATAEPITASLTIPSPYVLTVQQLEAEHDGIDGLIRIVTSQQLTGENIKSYLRLEPEVNYTVETNENGFAIRSDKFDIEKSYALTIQKGLRGKIGGEILPCRHSRHCYTYCT